MSANRTMLCETADRLFAKIADAPFDEGWAQIDEAGFADLLIAESAGGFGGDPGDLFEIQRLVGFHAVALPIGETIIGAALLARAGISHCGGAIALATESGGATEGPHTATVSDVPWGRSVDRVIIGSALGGVRVNGATAVVTQGESPAGEPRDTLSFDEGLSTPIDAKCGVDAMGAMLRVGQMAGALDRILALSIEHANQRQQFGKPLAKFQAVQQNLAILAVEAAAVNSAGAAMALAIDRRGLDDGGRFEIATAKLRANRAVGIGTAIAHQVHGAIGFTQEYPLHRFTRRLMGWRSEFGNDRFWADELGRRAAGRGGAGLWEMITARGDAGLG